MRTQTFEYRSQLPVAIESAFAWHEREGAFARYLPPWQRIDVRERHGTIRDGDRITLVVHRGPARATWELAHRGYDPPHQFVDTQVGGPYASWEHHHGFESLADGSTMTDRIIYQLGGSSALLGQRRHAALLERTFWYRHTRLLRDLRRHGADRAPMRVLITGASGTIGSALGAFLSTGGHEVWCMVRRPPLNDREIPWDPPGALPEPQRLEGFDAVVNLSGASIGGGRWSRRRRREIYQSRVPTTALLSETLAGLSSPPRVFYSQSAVGFYPSSTESDGPPLTEEANAGSGFLADLAQEWEAATAPAARAGIRVVIGRTGVVLARHAALVGRMLPLFRLGLGGVVSHGRQSLSWIGLDDVVGAIAFLLGDERAHGPVNLVAPEGATNREFTHTLAGLLRRPAMARVPAAALRLALGEMGEELAVRGQAVTPTRLLGLGFEFLEPTMAGAMAWELGVRRGGA